MSKQRRRRIRKLNRTSRKMLEVIVYCSSNFGKNWQMENFSLLHNYTNIRVILGLWNSLIFANKHLLEWVDIPKGTHLERAVFIKFMFIQLDGYDFLEIRGFPKLAILQVLLHIHFLFRFDLSFGHSASSLGLEILFFQDPLHLNIFSHFSIFFTPKCKRGIGQFPNTMFLR